MGGHLSASSSPFTRRPIPVLAAVVVAVALLVAWLPARGQESGWSVQEFHSAIGVGEDGTLTITETIAVDFGTLERHGIIREIIIRQRCGSLKAVGPDPLYECPGGSDRLYPLVIRSVSGADGQPIPHSISTEGGSANVRIGDPDRTITGEQTYVIDYTLEGMLNAFEGHDELYFNVTGGRWTVPIEHATANVTLPTGAELFVTCFEGFRSTAECESSASGNQVSYAATRTLFPSEELTIVAGWEKGVVTVPPPVLKDRVSPDDFFTLDFIEWGGFALFGLLGIAGLARAWWVFGRDRRYRSIYYLSEDPDEHTLPLFAEKNVVVEYLPPEDLRPAQLGVIIDERADTLDVTATIVDLAVRGYLSITELEKTGWFGKTDWEMEKLKPAGEEMEPYERHLFDALFEGRSKVKVSALKTKFHEDLAEVKDDLYDDAVAKKWFKRKPETVRQVWFAIGVFVLLVGVSLAVGSGFLFERALMPVPLALAGIVLMPLSRAMARRTAAGNEAYRRALGFKLYITTAETRRQKFNEQQNIFARYLPYAIVFECVDKWAEAFEGLDDQVQQSTGYWYHGAGAFHATSFAAGLGSFNSSVSSSISSTPGGSGGSGFSGGSSGGGGGGGGGSSW